MAQFSQDIDNQFKRIGFDNYQEMLANCIFQEGRQILEHNEKVAVLKGTGTESLSFQFSMDNIASRESGNIALIRIAFNKPIIGGNLDMRITLSETTFNAADGPLPTKATMIKRILAMRAKEARLSDINCGIIPYKRASPQLRNQGRRR